MLIKSHTAKVMKNIHETYAVSIKPGRGSLIVTLLFLFFVISILPFAFMFMDSSLIQMAESGIIHLQVEDENDIVFLIITASIIFVCIVVSIYTLSSQLKNSINSLLSVFKRVEEGELELSAPVITNDEIGQLAYNFNRMIAGLKEREEIKETFGRYVSGEIAEYVLSNKSLLEGEEKTVTILFSDIYNYTTISEGLSAQETVRLLNRYYNMLVEIVRNHKGVVNKFIGDALMVVFNTPISDPEHARHAVQCAQEIITVTENVTFEHDIKLKTRVGINTGTVVAGNLGSSDRYEYTVIGDPVNTAQRLENLNKKFDTRILFSASTLESAGNDIEAKPMGSVHIKGKAEPIQVYTIKEEI